MFPISSPDVIVKMCGGVFPRKRNTSMYDGWLLRIRRSRDRLLEDIRGAKFFAEVHEKTFSRLPLPPVTEEIVSAISSARHADFNLVFWAWLGAVALADHGRASVYLPGAGRRLP